ncbi:MAG: HAMP domain-containing histidine kinase [Cytophagaceae bacterium]|nr:HAMP domain-containing histidine kinase [Cytophagaceae bacterium]
MIEKSDVGLTQLTTLKERQELLTTLMKLSALVIITTSLPDFYFLIWESIAVIVLTVCTIGVFYYFNRKGHIEFAGSALAILLSILLFIQSSQLGFDSLVFLFYIPLIFGTPFIVDYKNNYLYYFHICHPIIFIAILFATDFSLLKIDNYNADQIKLVAEFNIIGVLVFCHYMVFIIIKSSKRSEKKFEHVVEDLNKQNIELQKINDELDRFVYSVSHDLRAPLASSLGLIELSKGETSIEKVLYYNLLKEKSLRRLDDYVTSLIDFSRNYRVGLLIEEIEFRALIDQCIELNRPCGDDSSRVHISMEVDQQSPFLGDSLRIRIVLNNLLSNALKYYDDEKEWSVLKIKVISDEHHVVIKFIDNGIGIDASLVNHVFDMFYRASERPKGSGLGLYITKEVIGKLNGTISLESVLGEGTSFTVVIPNQN